MDKVTYWELPTGTVGFPTDDELRGHPAHGLVFRTAEACLTAIEAVCGEFYAKGALRYIRLREGPTDTDLRRIHRTSNTDQTMRLIWEVLSFRFERSEDGLTPFFTVRRRIVQVRTIHKFGVIDGVDVKGSGVELHPLEDWQPAEELERYELEPVEMLLTFGDDTYPVRKTAS